MQAKCCSGQSDGCKCTFLVDSFLLFTSRTKTELPPGWLCRVVKSCGKILRHSSLTMSHLLQTSFDVNKVVVTELILDQHVESPPHPVMWSLSWWQHLSHGPFTWCRDNALNSHTPSQPESQRAHSISLCKTTNTHTDTHTETHTDYNYIRTAFCNASPCPETLLKDHIALEGQRKDRTCLCVSTSQCT